MIFVTVGMGPEPFDRLLRAIDGLPIDEELVVQHGPSSVRPARATCVDYLSYDEFVEHVRRARVVVASAGVGATVTALAHGKKPIVVPRLSRYGEWFDDHQSEFAHRVAAGGYVIVLEDPERLADVLATAGDLSAPPLASNGGRLVREVRAYLETAIEAAR